MKSSTKNKFIFVITGYYVSIVLIFIICNACDHEINREAKSKQEIEMSSKELFEIDNVSSDKQATLEQSAIIDIPIDTTSLNHSIYPVYYDADSSHYYVTSNRNQHSVDFYDLKTRKLAKRIKFAKEGGDGIVGLGFFYVKNLDTIIFLPKNTRHIIIANSQGKVLKRTYLKIQDDDELRHSLGAPFTLKDSLLIVSKMKTLPPMSLVGFNTMVGLNIHTGQASEYGPRLPLAFKEKQAPVGKESPLFAVEGDKINVRFGLLSAIYQYDMQSGQTIILPLKSKYQTEPITLSDYVDYTKMVQEVGEKQDFEKSSYQKLLYDPYREVYYSIFVEGIPLVNEATGQKNDYEDRPISIIIADKNFHYMGEKRLDGYYFRSFLATKDGLLVSNAHNKNPHNKEDVLSFTLFKLKYQ